MAKTYRHSPRKTSPRRRWSAVSGACATAANTTSSSPTTKRRRKFRRAARWSRSLKEHDPEKWVPVFGKDHAPEKVKFASLDDEGNSVPAARAAGISLGGRVILTLDNLTKSFGSLKAVDLSHLEVAQGEALGIIGPNGAGKSTLFNLITGLHTPDGGKV